MRTILNRVSRLFQRSSPITIRTSDIGATSKRSIMSPPMIHDPFNDAPIKRITAWNCDRGEEEAADVTVGLAPDSLQEAPGRGYGSCNGDKRPDLRDVELRPARADIAHDAYAVRPGVEEVLACRGAEMERHFGQLVSGETDDQGIDCSLAIEASYH